MNKKAMMLAFASAISMTSPALAEVYTVDLSGSGVSATGSITTDGTLGLLQQSNITDWLFNLNDGTSTFTLDGPTNSTVGFYSAPGLTATATGLFFDFSGTGAVLFQNPDQGSGINFICFTGSTFCGGGTNRISISVSSFGGGIAQTGVQQIASLDGVVPEPATWAMMIAGFGLVGSAMRRRQRITATVSYA